MKLAYAPVDSRGSHAVGRALLAEIYRSETGEEMPAIVLRERGKPCFQEGKWHFSITHTRRHVFCALSDRPVGIDAEEESRQVDLRLAERYFSQNEQARLATAADPRQAFLRIWVLKEAYAKLTGHGIGNYLKNTDFSPDDPRISQIDGCFVAVITEEGEAYAV